VSQAGVVSRLALRELWMSFRLLVVLAAALLAGAVAALLPAPPPVLMERLAVGLGIAAVVAGAMAAWSLAVERRRGRAAWLVARSVPRATVLSGWFVALAFVLAAGILVASVLGWLAASTVALRLDVAAFAAAVVAALAGSLALLALGTLAGVVLPSVVAVPLTIAAGVALGAASLLVETDLAWVPAAGSLVVLAAVRDGEASLGPALVAAGVGLATAALLLVCARIAFDRVEL
jgi:hypothetical protein